MKQQTEVEKLRKALWNILRADVDNHIPDDLHADAREALGMNECPCACHHTGPRSPACSDCEWRHGCDCDCHYADSGALICSQCFSNHSPEEAERQVAKDIPAILRAFAQEMDDEDE